MIKSSVLAIRCRKGLRLWRLPEKAADVQGIASICEFCIEENVQGMEWAQNNSYFLMATDQGSSIYTVDDDLSCEKAADLPIPKLKNCCFSPKGTYLVCGSAANTGGPGPGTGGQGDGSSNCFIWRIERPKGISLMVEERIKTGALFPVRWTEDEKYRIVFRDGELEVYDGELRGGVERALYRRSMGAAYRMTIFPPRPGCLLLGFFLPTNVNSESRNSDLIVILLQRSNGGDFLISNVHRLALPDTDGLEFQWSPSQRYALIQRSTLVDPHGRNYGSIGDLYLLDTWDIHARLPPYTDPWEEPSMLKVRKINKRVSRDACWSPVRDEFISIEGKAPNDMFLIHARTRTRLHTFPKGYKNTIRWSPHGDMIALGGFGNLAGDLSFFYRAPPDDEYKPEVDPDKIVLVAEWREACTVLCDWSPCGQFFLTASTRPRMFVDNHINIWDRQGNLVLHEPFEALYDVVWKALPDPTSTIPAISAYAPHSNLIDEACVGAHADSAQSSGDAEPAADPLADADAESPGNKSAPPSQPAFEGSHLLEAKLAALGFPLLPAPEPNLSKMRPRAQSANLENEDEVTRDVLLRYIRDEIDEAALPEAVRKTLKGKRRQDKRRVEQQMATDDPMFWNDWRSRGAMPSQTPVIDAPVEGPRAPAGQLPPPDVSQVSKDPDQPRPSPTQLAASVAASLAAPTLPKAALEQIDTTQMEESGISPDYGGVGQVSITQPITNRGPPPSDIDRRRLQDDQEHRTLMMLAGEGARGTQQYPPQISQGRLPPPFEGGYRPSPANPQVVSPGPFAASHRPSEVFEKDDYTAVWPDAHRPSDGDALNNWLQRESVQEALKIVQQAKKRLMMEESSEFESRPRVCVPEHLNLRRDQPTGYYPPERQSDRPFGDARLFKDPDNLLVEGRQFPPEGHPYPAADQYRAAEAHPYSDARPLTEARLYEEAAPVTDACSYEEMRQLADGRPYAEVHPLTGARQYGDSRLPGEARQYGDSRPLAGPYGEVRPLGEGLQHAKQVGQFTGQYGDARHFAEARQYTAACQYRDGRDGPEIRPFVYSDCYDNRVNESRHFPLDPSRVHEQHTRAYTDEQADDYQANEKKRWSVDESRWNEDKRWQQTDPCLDLLEKLTATIRQDASSGGSLGDARRTDIVRPQQDASLPSMRTNPSAQENRVNERRSMVRKAEPERGGEDSGDLVSLLASILPKTANIRVQTTNNTPPEPPPTPPPRKAAVRNTEQEKFMQLVRQAGLTERPQPRRPPAAPEPSLFQSHQLASKKTAPADPPEIAGEDRLNQGVRALLRELQRKHRSDERIWQYVDPKGNVQGPFSWGEMRTWYEKGYFKGSLPIRQAETDEFLPLSKMFPNPQTVFISFS